MGYSCDGYTITNEIGKSEVWITRDETFGTENFFNAGNMGIKSKFLSEMQSEVLKTGDKSIITHKNWRRISKIL
jgi:hypothetical protein